MNFIDLLFLLLFFGMLAAGFFQGMIRLLVMIVALYLAVVLASLYYAPLGEFFVRNFSTQRFVGQYIAFFLVMFISFVLLTLAGLYTFRYAKLPGGLEYLDRIIGAVLGMLLGVLLIGIFGGLLYNLMILRGGRNIELPLFAALGNSVARSTLIGYFSNVLLPLAYDYVDPILPEGADLLFRVQ
ncbi:MAG TPA: CvpA family protein [Chloroflexaceae bacterium]|nr:CvpA family protein [Chloroflexaceae bacterium]